MVIKNAFINKDNYLVPSMNDLNPVQPQEVKLDLRENENKVRWNVLCDPGDTVTIVIERKKQDANDRKFRKKGPFEEYFQKEGIDIIQYNGDVAGWEDEKTGPVQHEPPSDSEEYWKFTIFRTKADGKSHNTQDPGLRVRK